MYFIGQAAVNSFIELDARDKLHAHSYCPGCCQWLDYIHRTQSVLCYCLGFGILSSLDQTLRAVSLPLLWQVSCALTRSGELRTQKL